MQFVNNLYTKWVYDFDHFKIRAGEMAYRMYLSSIKVLYQREKMISLIGNLKKVLLLGYTY